MSVNRRGPDPQRGGPPGELGSEGRTPHADAIGLTTADAEHEPSLPCASRDAVAIVLLALFAGIAAAHSAATHLAAEAIHADPNADPNAHPPDASAGADAPAFLPAHGAQLPKPAGHALLAPIHRASEHGLSDAARDVLAQILAAQLPPPIDSVPDLKPPKLLAELGAALDARPAREAYPEPPLFTVGVQRGPRPFGAPRPAGSESANFLITVPEGNPAFVVLLIVVVG